MKKICTLLAVSFFCTNLASADPLNMMRPAGNPLMQTIQLNEAEKNLYNSLDKQKEKEIRLEKMEQETIENLRGVPIKPEEKKEEINPSSSNTFNTDNKNALTKVEKINYVDTTNEFSVTEQQAQHDARYILRKQREAEFLRAEEEKIAKKAQKAALKEEKSSEKKVFFKRDKIIKKKAEQNKELTPKQLEKIAKKQQKAEEKTEKKRIKEALRQQEAQEKKAREEAFHKAISDRTALRKEQRAVKKAKSPRTIKKQEKKAAKLKKKEQKRIEKQNREIYRENARRTDTYEKERELQEKALKKQEREALKQLKKENPELAKQKRAEKKINLKQKREAEKAAAKEIKLKNKQIREEKKKVNSHFKDEKPLVLIKYENEENQEEDSQESKPKFNLRTKKEIQDLGPSVYIRKVEFSPSQVFTENELDEMVGPLLGQTVTMADIKNLVNSINRAYIINDYVTSRAYLPPQKIENGVLKINLFEGKVGEIIVRGNAWTRKSYITKRVGLDEGELFKLRVLENSLIKFNNDHYDYSRNPFSIKAKLAPGKEPGTTDIIVDTNDPLPFHITGVFDNQGRDSIGLLRGGVMASTDSLTGNRDKLSLGSYFGRGTQIYFGDYNIPINKYGTRAGVSVSYNHINVIKGSYSPFDISGNAFVYTAYLTHPLINRPDLALNTFTAANFKTSKTYFQDVPIYSSKVASGTQGFSLRKDTKKGIWYTGHYATVGYMDTVPAHDMYWKYDGNITRLHDFGHGIIGQFRASAQISPHQMLPWIEQFQIGGLSSVRGYSEGLLIGRSGYFLSAELITPIPFLPKKFGTEKLGFVNLREMVKFALFFDQGAVFPYKGVDTHYDSSDVLASIGPGLRIRLNDYLNARLYWGFGLIQNKFEQRQSTGRFHFELTSSPDLAALMKYRKHRETIPHSEKL